jgi:hypothetical protein
LKDNNIINVGEHGDYSIQRINVGGTTQALVVKKDSKINPN